MKTLRTPDSCFDTVPEFPFEPHYVEIGGLRIHYVDAGEGSPVLCLHGVPAWSFVYRKLIAALAPDARMLAMDFAGFGRSDKPEELESHSLEFHHETLLGFVRALDLRNVTLVVHDWGGLIGLTAVEAMQDRIDRLVIMNTGLPTGEEPTPQDFLIWRSFVERVADLPIGKVVRSGLAQPHSMSREVVAAYDAPFPDASYKAAVRALPMMVPIRPEDHLVPHMQRGRQFLRSWTRPALVLFSDSDPVTRTGEELFRRLIPSAAREPAITIREAGHFLQEEKGEEVAANIAAFLRR
jgi:haloalkane dehalogenase